MCVHVYTHARTRACTSRPSLWEVCANHTYQNFIWITNEREKKIFSAYSFPYQFIIIYSSTCCTSDLEERKGDSVPPDLWLVMQLTYSSCPWGSHNSTDKLSQLYKWEMPQGNESQAKHGGNKTNISGYIEQSATFIQSFKSRDFAYM